MASRHQLSTSASGMDISVEAEVLSGGTNITVVSITTLPPGLDAHRVLLMVIQIDAFLYSVELRIRDEAYEAQIAKDIPSSRGYLRR